MNFSNTEVVVLTSLSILIVLNIRLLIIKVISNKVNTSINKRKWSERELIIMTEIALYYNNQDMEYMLNIKKEASAMNRPWPLVDFKVKEIQDYHNQWLYNKEIPSYEEAFVSVTAIKHKINKNY